jgi:hypothetical protein
MRLLYSGFVLFGLGAIFWGSCVVLGQQTTSVSLTTSGTVAVLGQPVNMTATVNPAATGGLVTFYDGVSILGYERWRPVRRR